MFHRIAALVVVGLVCGVGSAYAQDAAAGPAPIEITYIPAGAAYVMEKGAAPSFGNYTFGTAVAFNLNPVVAIEGELSAMIATTSSLQFGDVSSEIKAPNSFNYTANLIVSPWAGHSVVPYAAAGVGGLTMFERPALGVFSEETFLSGNVGGGVKWFAPTGRWGLRADYRFVLTQLQDDEPAFFGRDNRYAHRLYAGVIINAR